MEQPLFEVFGRGEERGEKEGRRAPLYAHTHARVGCVARRAHTSSSSSLTSASPLPLPSVSLFAHTQQCLAPDPPLRSCSAFVTLLFLFYDQLYPKPHAPLLQTPCAIRNASTRRGHGGGQVHRPCASHIELISHWHELYPHQKGQYPSF